MQKASVRKKAWAKKGEDGWHSLLGHSADVAAVMKVLLRETLLSSRLGRLAGTDLSETHLDRLAVLAALHDAGKANRGFQQGTAGHLSPIIGLFSHGQGAKYLAPLPLQKMTSWFQNGGHLRRFLTATWSHHGEPIPEANPQISAWQPGDTYNPCKELDRLSEGVQKWLPGAFSGGEPFPDEPALENTFAGALTLSDWIGSDKRYFPLENGNDERVWDRSMHRAEGALRDMGVVHDLPHSGLHTLLGDYDPYEFQAEGAALNGQVVVAEGPTGSGKTELALGRYARLRREGKVEGMYFGVPTRAAAKQIHGRISDISEKIFDNPPPVVQAVPGYIKADDERGIRRGWDVYWEGASSRRNWAAEQSKRYTAAPIAVGTIDQALLAMLETPHAHMRMAGLLGSLLVVDEVHSTSTYMMEVLEEVVQVHAAAGGHALLMSATVQSGTRSSVLGRQPLDLSEAKQTDYPYVVSGADEASPTIPDQLKKTVQIEVREARDPETEFRQAVENHADKGRVLGIRNTVDGAREVHKALSCNRLSVEDKAHSVCHHSRYAQPDRDLLDETLISVYGEENKDGDETLAAIATQTVEQSLDIDSDVMVTDLVPMPVFLQRLGRLWRHPGRPRPSGIDVAKCIVVAPDRDMETYLSDGEAYGPMGIGTVYEDLRILQATLDELRTREKITIPGDSRALVENATHREVLTRICDSEDWEAHEQHVLGEQAGEETQADLVRLDWLSTRYSKMRFTGADVRSRLGELPHTVELSATTPFGNEIAELDIPAWMLEDDGDPLNPGPEDAELTSQAKDHFTFDVCGKPFIYTRYGFRENGS